MASAQDIVLKYVCPGLGAGVVLVLFASPMPAVLQVNRTKQLGELNVLPLAMMAAACICLVIYGFLNKDYFLYLGNVPGLLLAIFYVLTCYKYSTESAQDGLKYLLLGVVALICSLGLVNMAATHTFAAAKTLWGATAAAVLACFYTAPLTTVYQVLITRSSASLHWPLCLMNSINGSLWFAYGLAIKDWFVCVPNGLGAAFNMGCVALCLIFPRSRGESTDSDTGTHLGRNWSLLRLQSKHIPASAHPALEPWKAEPVSQPGIPLRAAAAGSRPHHGHSFLDVSRMRWRAGDEALPNADVSTMPQQQQQQQQEEEVQRDTAAQGQV